MKEGKMIKFGPSGMSEMLVNAGCKHTTDAAKVLHELGLNAYEYAFSKGITLSDTKALEIGEEMEKYGVSVSVHSPYFINFANQDDVLVEKSYAYVINSIKKMRLLKSNRLVVHTASQGKMTREEALNLTKIRLNILAQKLRDENMLDVLICLETMGKPAQIGNYKEVIDFCKISENFIPTFDFGHINALTQGGLKTYNDYLQIFNYAINELGREKIQNVHIHFSKIEYGAKGELRHLTFEDTKYGPKFEPLAKVIKDLDLTPFIICESRGTQSEDALEMKRIYENVK